MAVSRIMAVIDPTQADQPAFRRALQSARMTNAELHVYCCLDTVDSLEVVTETRGALAALAEEAAKEGVECQREVEHSPQWAQQMARAAARKNVDMIFKNSFEHRDVDREKRETSDWALLRLSPCPVLLVKNHRDWGHRRVLAAINDQTTDEAHIRLNHRITLITREFCESYGSDAHFVVAYRDRNHPPDPYTLSSALGATIEHVHVAEGPAAAVISEIADAIEADLVIIGTVARDGIKGAVVGNTAERVLDHTRADVLVLN